VHGVPHLDERQPGQGEKVMKGSNDHAKDGGVTYHVDPEATVHELMNAATEWLQLARGLTRLLADLVHEADAVDCQRMAIGLEGIGALTLMGVQCAAQAHVRMCWEKTSATGDP
jgi:hypothetical protein